MIKKSGVKNSALVLALFTASTGVIAQTDSNIEALEARITQLEKLLEQQMQHQKKQSQQVESVTVKKQQDSRLASKPDSKMKGNHGISVYGSLRPRLTYREEGGKSSTDVTDALSRIGFKGTMVVNDSITAFAQGEWDVDMESSGNFGDARLAYVGVEGDYGRVAIGQQWNPHYNTVAQVTDIFVHRSSPFAYDNVGTFRTTNLVTYSINWGDLRIESAIETNGDLDISDNSGDESQSNYHGHIDSGSLGVGYHFNSVYLGASFLEQQLADSKSNDSQRSLLSLASSWGVYEDLYLAFTYQDVTVEQASLADLDQFTLDLVGSYALGDGYSVKTGLFWFDDDVEGTGSSAQDGYNLTLEKQIGNLRLFTEWLSRNFEERAERKTLSVGIRYDFELAF